MRRLIGLLAMIFVAVLTWTIGTKLSNDAVGMILGLIMGILASMPAMLLVLAHRQQERDADLDCWDSYTVVDEHPMQTGPTVQECTVIQVLHDRFAADEQRQQYTQWLIGQKAVQAATEIDGYEWLPFDGSHTGGALG